MHSRIISTTLLLALLATTGIAHAGERRDDRLADDISRSINTHTQLTIFDDVCAQIQNGVVTLTGKVTAEYKKEAVSRVVGRLDGVREVRNQIGVLPASPFDDELRYRASRAIYSNPAFWSYASMARPPIHVIVENGRVTLTGVVASEVERALARSLATGLGELSITNQLRTETSKQ
jgi:hyperosmotically inducible periplasmic protein